jgi:hypothetical protein
MQTHDYLLIAGTGAFLIAMAYYTIQDFRKTRELRHQQARFMHMYRCEREPDQHPAECASYRMEDYP